MMYPMPTQVGSLPRERVLLVAVHDLRAKTRSSDVERDRRRASVAERRAAEERGVWAVPGDVRQHDAVRIAPNVVIAPSTCRKSGQNGRLNAATSRARLPDHERRGSRASRRRRRTRARAPSGRGAGRAARRSSCRPRRRGARRAHASLLVAAARAAERAGEDPEDERSPDPAGAERRSRGRATARCRRRAFRATPAKMSGSAYRMSLSRNAVSLGRSDRIASTLRIAAAVDPPTRQNAAAMCSISSQSVLVTGRA